jgi:hypothetical protein
MGKAGGVQISNGFDHFGICYGNSTQRFQHRLMEAPTDNTPDFLS